MAAFSVGTRFPRGLNELSIVPMNALSGLSANPVISASSSPPAKAKVQVRGEQNSVVSLVLALVLVLVSVAYLRRQQSVYNATESAVIWALALSHIVYHTFRYKSVHLVVNAAVVVISIAYWAVHLIESPNEALFIQLLLLSVLQSLV